MSELPSQEAILSLLRDEPMTGSRLRGALGVPKKMKLSFKQKLADMVHYGVLSRNGKKEYLPGNPDKIEAAEETRDNRRPAARSRTQKTRTEASVKRGILHYAGKDRWVVKELSTEKEYPVAHRKDAPGKEGETIAFSLYPHPKLKHTMLARVEKTNMPQLSWKEVTAQFMQENHLSAEFSETIREYVDAKQIPGAKDFKGRADYRALSVVCIDPEGARDHDDAVSVEILPDGTYQLGVHIADVSYYVSEGSELDSEALERSFTQYLPWQAVPMLPERLSGDLCSLHEGVDRLAFTCMIHLNTKGEVISYRFERSVVHVKTSVTYGQAVELLNQGNVEIKNLAAVARLLKENRSRNGILELGSTEFYCMFDDKNEPLKIVPRESDESNSWIEECMLIANQCCAKELKRRGLQGIYRIHEAPETRDIMELYYLLPDLFKDAPVSIRDLGKPRQGDSNLNPMLFSLYQHLVKRAGHDEAMINRILRSMQKAHYDSNSFGHFALNWQDYAHFTSPIRRYADLWCHRELARTPKEEKKARANNVIEVCDLISANEVKNQKLERVAVKVCAAWLLKDRLGETFEAKVTGAEEWGIFVALLDPVAEGLVRFRDIAIDDYFIYNADKGYVFGKRSGKTFRRGDRVQVQVLRVNPLRGEIDFAILEKLSKEPSRRKPAAEFDSRASAAEEMGFLSAPAERERKKTPRKRRS